jgi:undecaprenyl-diphosphatase
MCPVDRSGWRARLFRPAGESPRRRSRGDVVRVALTAVLLVLAARHVGDVTRSEQAVFDFFNTLPGNLEPLFRALYRLGTLWAVGLVVVAALIGRRWRLGRDLLVAGVLAWAVGRLIAELVVEHESIGRSVRVAAGTGGVPPFPAVRLAVTVAVIGVAAPYVTRPTRILGYLLAGGVAASALYLGTTFPVDVFAGIVLGWGVAAAVHLAFGSPGARPTLSQVVDALAHLGVVAHDARLATHQPANSTLVLADDECGPIRVKVIGRDDARGRRLERVRNSLLYRGAGPRISTSRVAQVEHEAYVLLGAAQAGVPVPEVVAAGSGGPRAAVLVTRPVDGRELQELAPEDVDDAFLAGLWTSVRRLHDAHVVHDDLDPEHVIVVDGCAWFVGFDDAQQTGDPDLAARDVAQMLVATAALVGPERAVDAALAVLGPDAVERTLPRLQPAALSPATRAMCASNHRDLVAHLDDVRRVGADRVGIEPPELQQLRRVTGTSAAMAIGGLVAVAVLLADVGDPSDVWATMRSADWSWFALALALSLVANIAYAFALQGTVRVRLPIIATTEVQLGMSFSNLAVPAIGGQGMQVRFLQKLGVDLPSAVAAGGVLSAFGGLVAALGLFVLALLVEPAHVDLSLIPTNGLLLTTLLTVGLVVVTGTVVGLFPRLRALVFPPLTRALSTMWTAIRSPWQLSLLVGGNVLATLLSTWCLMACLAAFGGHTSFWALLAANIGVVTIASIVPIPGGGTAVGTVGLSAVLVSFGVPREIAVAAVLANQLAYYYLPAVPGWFATRDLIRRDYL